jgi:endonuclease/exonuclease/phosphatase family metal-dependent hydrolase
MLLATWNVMLPVAERRRTALREHIDAIAPDVIVLTESHVGFDAGLPNRCGSASGRDGLHGTAHRWVEICSRWPLEQLATSDERRTAAARVIPDDGAPFIVFGTVLPWIGSPWRDQPSAGGAAFAAALALQLGDWRSLRGAHPTEEIFVAGDFNQDLIEPGGKRYYGSRRNRERLEGALRDAGLVALTGGADDPIRRDSTPCACIDHIAGRADSAWRVVRTIRWPDRMVPERWLTDHFGVAVELVRSDLMVPAINRRGDSRS